jgi:glycosyltransferase involved in cell wall biosynthesis
MRRTRSQTTITHVVVSYGRSGSEQIVLDLSARFVADGAAVTVVIPRGSASLDRMAPEALERGAAVERVAPLYPGDRDHRRNLTELYALFTKLRPSVVHYHIPRAFSGFEAILAGYLARVPCRIRTDQNPIVSTPTRAERVRLRAADAMVHRIVLVSLDNRRSHLRHRRAEKCVTIPNGVDISTIDCKRDPSARREVRQQLGIPVDVPVTVMVAALAERKGVIDYVRAARMASSIVPSMHHAILGDGDILGRLRQLAVDLGMTDRVHFLGRREDVRSILSSFDVFVLPSHYEGMAITMLEALAAGLPMVTTRVDGVADVLPDERGALFVDKYDHVAMGRAMARLGQDPDLRERLSRISQPRVWGEFTLDNLYDRYRHMYHELGAFG